MRTTILIDSKVACVCDRVEIDKAGGAYSAIIGDRVEAIFPIGQGELSTEVDLELPADWPGVGYTYAAGKFTAIGAEVAVAEVPQSVSNFQGRAILEIYNLTAAVEKVLGFIEDETQRKVAMVAYERAPFSRTSPLLLSVAKLVWPEMKPAAIDAALDQMFVRAAAIKV